MAFVGLSVPSRVKFGGDRRSVRGLDRVRWTCVAMASVELIKGGGVTTPLGFRAVGMKAGFKESGGMDLAVIVADEICSAAGVFTKNVVCAPPVTVCKEQLNSSGGRAMAIVVNSGQANAATGEEGMNVARETTKIVAEELNIDSNLVLVASTGVIGKQIDLSKLKAAVPKALKDATREGGDLAAKAIMTTDLIDKKIAVKVELSSGVVTVGGMCKGSGMIHPNMATMLGFVTTDVVVEPGVWSSLVRGSTTRSFNQITVDGDTSTNDCVLALASGGSGIKAESKDDVQKLGEALDACCIHLAKSIARDGEGATILLQIEVSGTETDEDAATIAKTIAGSSLVKSAIFGRDPNWGRIAAAAGRAGVQFAQEDLNVNLGPFEMMRNGQPVPYDKNSASDYMKKCAEAGYLSGEDTVCITVSVGNAAGKGKAWGCDLSYDYVRINAEYTT